MTKTNAPTMKDVAKEAGVSLGTVSKVINGITVREELGCGQFLDLMSKDVRRKK